MKTKSFLLIIAMTISLLGYSQYDVCQHISGTYVPVQPQPDTAYLWSGDTLFYCALNLQDSLWVPNTGITNCIWYENYSNAINSYFYVLNYPEDSVIGIRCEVSYHGDYIFLKDYLIKIVPAPVTYSVCFSHEGIWTKLTDNMTFLQGDTLGICENDGSTWTLSTQTGFWLINGNLHSLSSIYVLEPFNGEICVQILTPALYECYSNITATAITHVSSYEIDEVIVTSEIISFKEITEYRIFTPTGSMIRNGKNIEVNISDLKSGIYILSTNKSSLKFIKN